MSASQTIILNLLLQIVELQARDAAVGDLFELNISFPQSVRELCGLIVRQQAKHLKEWHPWLAFVGIVGLVGIPLNYIFLLLTSILATNMRTYLRHGVRYETGLSLVEDVFMCGVIMSGIALWSWTAGLVFTYISRKTALFTGLLVVAAVLCRDVVATSSHVALMPWLFGLRILFLLPAALGMRNVLRHSTNQKHKVISIATIVVTGLALWVSKWPYLALEQWSGGALHLNFSWYCGSLPYLLASWPALFLVCRAGRTRTSPATVACVAALLLFQPAFGQQTGALGALTPIKQRRMAPDFTLVDATGKSIKLSAYKGKVVLLDFWATWCGGCKVEIPWFVEFDRHYRNAGLAVVGVSMDEKGMKVVKPFLVERHIRYPVVIGNDALGEQYHLTSMPLTLLIDRKSRIALTHTGVVDRSNFEQQIRTLLTR